MYSSRGFRFHKFSDFSPNDTHISFEKSKYFTKTMNNNLFSKNTFNNKEEKKENNSNNNLTTYRFYNSNKNNNELIFQNPFPVKEIINTDFQQFTKLKNFSELKNFLPQMAYQNIEPQSNLIFKNNPHLTLLINQFQHFLQYLLNTEKTLNEYNDILKQSEKDIYADKQKLIEKELKLNKKIDENDNKIIDIENKINNYKQFIINKNIEMQNKNLVFHVLDIHDDEGNYYCDICADRVFESYEDVQEHYELEHQNIIKLREKKYKYLNDILVNNYNYENYYFQTQLNNAKNEIKFFLNELNDERQNKNKINESNKDYQNQNYKRKNMKNLTSKDLNINNLKEEEEEENNYFNENDNDMEYFNNKLDTFEKMQKLYNDNLQKSFDTFKNEIFTQLKNLKNNKPIIIKDSYKFNINNDINNQLNLGEKYDNTSIHDSNNDNANLKLNYNNTNYFNNNDYNLNKNNEENKNNLKNAKIKQKNLNINDFAKIYMNSEKALLLNKQEYTLKNLDNEYDILGNQNNKSILIKTNKKIKEINIKYNLDNKDEKTIDEYKKIINNIYNNNKNLTQKTGNNHFDDILEKIDAKKYLEDILE